MNFLPLGERVLVQREEEASKTSSGIYIPDNAKEKPLTGIIKAVSKNTKDGTNLKEGDKIVFGKYSGTELTLEAKEYLVLEIKDILGIIN